MKKISLLLSVLAFSLDASRNLSIGVVDMGKMWAISEKNDNPVLQDFMKYIPFTEEQQKYLSAWAEEMQLDVLIINPQYASFAADLTENFVAWLNSNYKKLGVLNV